MPFKASRILLGIVATEDRPELDTGHAAKHHRGRVGVHHRDRIRSRLIQLAVNHRFVGRLESGFFILIPAIEIGDDDIAEFGKKQTGFFRSAAADQHVRAARRALTWPVVSLNMPSLARMRHDSATLRAKNGSVFKVFSLWRQNTFVEIALQCDFRSHQFLSCASPGADLTCGRLQKK